MSTKKVFHFTSESWEKCDDPFRMLKYIRWTKIRISRKGRLLSVACCRLNQHLITNSLLLTALDIAEQFADGLLSKEYIKSVRKELIVYGKSCFYGGREWSLVQALIESLETQAGRACDSALYYSLLPGSP